MNDTTVARPARLGRARNVGLWTLQAALAFLLVNAGLLKLTADPAMVDLFSDIGAGQWLRVVVGTLEVAGAVGLLVPMLCGLAALGVTALMAGAAVTNVLVIHESPWLPIALMAVAGLIGYARRARTAAFVETLRRRTVAARRPVGRTA